MECVVEFGITHNPDNAMMPAILVLLAWTLGMRGADYRHTYPLPDMTVPSGWGVNIHFTDPRPGEMQKLASGGFKWVRMDFAWGGIERQKGAYDFSAYDRLIASLKPFGIRPVLILDYGNDLYEQGSPRTDAGRQAFCRFVEAAMRHFRGQGIVWEMWNEPNIGFWKPNPNVDEYIALAKAVGETIRRIAPTEWFVGPAVSGFDWDFLQRCIDAGLLRYWDAVSVHPYRGSAPETVEDDWSRLRRMIDAKAPRGKAIPMFSGEWGYSSLTGGVSLEQQGAYAARQYLVNIMCGVPLSIWYDWKNDGVNPADNESNFGSVAQDLRPKPAFLEIQKVSRALAGYRFKMRLTQKSDEDYALAFQKGREVKYIAWTTRSSGKSVELSLGLDSKRVDLTDAPTILLSQDPKFVLDARNLPSEFEIGGPEATRELVKRVLMSESWVPGGNRLLPNSLTLSADGSDLSQKVTAANFAQVVSRFARAIDDHWSAEPANLRFSFLEGESFILGQVACIQPRPVSVNVFVTNRGAFAEIQNPGRREFWENVQWSQHGVNPGVLFTDRQPSTQIAPISPTGALRSGETVTIRLFPYANPPNRGLLLNPPDLANAGQPALQLKDIVPTGFGGLQAGLQGGRYTLTQDGDPSLHAAASASALSLDDGPLSGSEGLRIDYQFPAGWKFLEFRPQGDMAKPVPWRPSKLNMFVKGDASGDMLRMRFADATGQTFQPDYGKIDWNGWRFVSFNLRDSGVGHWGGANDGVIHYPIRLETLMLIDSAHGRIAPHSLTVAGITLITRK